MTAEAAEAVYQEYMDAAGEVLAGVRSDKAAARLQKTAVGASGLLSSSGEAMRWFSIPGDGSDPSCVLSCWVFGSLPRAAARCTRGARVCPQEDAAAAGRDDGSDGSCWGGDSHCGA